MGSQVSPVIANLFMEEMETKTLTESFRLIIWLKSAGRQRCTNLWKFKLRKNPTVLSIIECILRKSRPIGNSMQNYMNIRNNCHIKHFVKIK